MVVNLDKLQIVHLPEAGRFEIHADGYTTELNYSLRGDTIIFTHTGVPSALEGQGFGRKLVQAGLEYARENALTVQTTCWFVRGFLRRHPEYNDLLESKTAP